MLSGASRIDIVYGKREKRGTTSEPYDSEFKVMKH